MVRTLSPCIALASVLIACPVAQDTPPDVAGDGGADGRGGGAAGAVDDDDGAGDVGEDGDIQDGDGGEPGDGGGGDDGASPPRSAFLDLLATLDATPVPERQALVDAYWEGRATPDVEGEIASFVYRDRDARVVELAGDHTGWDAAPEPLARVEGTDLHHVSYIVPVDARIDYKLIVDGEWLLDPHNPHTCPSGFGDNSELRMPAWAYPTLIDFVPTHPHGAVNDVTVAADGAYAPLTLHSEVLDDERDVFIYTPPGYDPAVAYPLLVVNDGGDYLRLARMPNVLDNLLAAGAIEPLVVVFVSPVDRRNEYVGTKVARYVTLVDTELLPFVEQRVSVSADRARHAVMGTSFGGFISMRLTHDLPHRFSMFASQSGILLYDGGATLDDLSAASDVKVWLDVGRIGDALDDSRAARDHFEATDIEHDYLEVNEGHSWGSWRARVDDILVALFPSP